MSHTAEGLGAEARPLGGPAGPRELNKFGIWVWLASDCALFAALIATYLALHGSTHGAPGPKQLFDLKATAAATFVLLFSSMTMGFALEAAQHGDSRRALRWLITTAVLGLAFVSMQAVEFTTYARAGLSMSASDFGASFFTLVGFHGMHVSFGVAWLTSLIVYTVRKGRIPKSQLWRFEAASLYWYFVDVVWVVIFTVVYLMGKVG